MSRTLVLIALFLLGTETAADAQPVLGNSFGFRTVSGTGIDALYRAVLPNGDIAFAGYFDGTVDFDVTADEKLLASSGTQSMFLVRYTTQGKLVFVKTFASHGGEGQNCIRGLRADQHNNLYLSSSFRGRIEFSSKQQVNSSASYKHNSFFARFDTAGNPVLIRQLDGFKNLGFAIDTSGNFYLGGSYKDQSPDYDPGELVFPVPIDGNEHGHLAKYDRDGKKIFVRTFPCTIYSDVKFISVDRKGEYIYLGMQYRGVVNVGSGTRNEITSIEKEDTDNLVLKLAQTGVVVWAKPFGGKGGDNINQMAVDAEGNLLVSGNFTSLLDFFDYNHELNNEGGLDGFVVKFSSEEGNVVWVRHVGGSGWETVYGIGITASGNVLATGRFNSQHIGVDDKQLETTGDVDAFCLMLDGKTGKLLWAFTFGTPDGEDRTGCTEVDDEGNFYLVGFVSSGAVDLDPGLEKRGIAEIQSPSHFFAHYRLKDVETPTATLESWGANVFPNPATGIFFVETQNLPPNEQVTVTVRNTQGQVVAHQTESSSIELIMFNTAGWASGVYEVEISIRSGERRSFSMICQ